MDALLLDAAVLAGGLVLGVAVRGRKPAVRRQAPPRVASIARSVRDVRRRHRRVSRAIVALAYECLERHPDGSFEAFTARETLATYLPETLAAYLAVPRALRRIRRGNAPSADDELSRQLAMLRVGLERIRDAAAASGAARMAANGAFLAERFVVPDAGEWPKRRPNVGVFSEVVESVIRRF